jgi:hypothetical protein
MIKSDYKKLKTEEMDPLYSGNQINLSYMSNSYKSSDEQQQQQQQQHLQQQQQQQQQNPTQSASIDSNSGNLS